MLLALVPVSAYSPASWSPSTDLPAPVMWRGVLATDVVQEGKGLSAWTGGRTCVTCSTDLLSGAG